MSGTFLPEVVTKMIKVHMRFNLELAIYWVFPIPVRHKHGLDWLYTGYFQFLCTTNTDWNWLYTGYFQFQCMTNTDWNWLYTGDFFLYNLLKLMFDFLCFSVGYDLDEEGCVCFVSMD